MEETDALVRRLKDCPTLPGVDEILVPGEPERGTQAQRLRAGIYIEDATWLRISKIAQDRDVAVPILSELGLT